MVSKRYRINSSYRDGGVAKTNRQKKKKAKMMQVLLYESTQVLWKGTSVSLLNLV